MAKRANTEANVNLTFTLPPALLARVDACARESGASRAEMLRTFVREGCTAHEREAVRRGRLARAATRGEGAA